MQTKQKLDEQENNSEIEWFDLKTLAVNYTHFYGGIKNVNDIKSQKT